MHSNKEDLASFSAGFLWSLLSSLFFLPELYVGYGEVSILIVYSSMTCFVVFFFLNLGSRDLDVVFLKM